MQVTPSPTSTPLPPPSPALEPPPPAQAAVVAGPRPGEPEVERGALEIPVREAALAERIVVAGEVLRIERAFGFEAGRLAQVEVWCRSADQDLGRLQGLELTPVEAHRLLDHLEGQLSAAEDTLFEIDARVPLAVFRRIFGADRRAELEEAVVEGELRSPIEVTPELLSRYARFLAARFDGRSASAQRIRHLVDRLLVTTRDDGELLVHPWKDARARLEYIVGDRAASRSVTDAALAFFATAHARLADTARIDELFEDGFYLDLVGYQLALRAGLLEPRVLYASAVLDAAVSKKLTDLVRLEGAVLQDVKLRLFEAYLQAVATFDGGGTEAPEEISSRVAAAPSQKRGAAGWMAPRLGALGRSIAVLVAVLVVAMTVGTMRRSTRDANELAPLQKAELERISPVLLSGSFSRGESEPVFVGHVSPTEWSAMPRAKRSSFVRQLQTELATRGVKVALVFADGQVVVELLHGQVLFVD